MSKSDLQLLSKISLRYKHKDSDAKGAFLDLFRKSEKNPKTKTLRICVTAFAFNF